MARQTGPNFTTGTRGIACFYKWGDRYFFRRKSSLTAETVKKRPEFANSRKSASDLATASVLTSGMYRSMPKEKRNVYMYRKMTGIAKVMLKEGKPREAINTALQNCATGFFGWPKKRRVINRRQHKRRDSISMLKSPMRVHVCLPDGQGKELIMYHCLVLADSLCI